MVLRAMKQASQLWFLVPHAVSGACFAAAFVWMSIARTNRTEADLNLAIIGFAALAVAVLSSISAVFIVFRRGARRYWPWLLAHLAALAFALMLAHRWLGSHIA